MLQLTSTRPRDRVLIECIGLQIRRFMSESEHGMCLDEPSRFALEHHLLDHKREYPHEYEINVQLTHRDKRPVIDIIVGGLRLYTLG